MVPIINEFTLSITMIVEKKKIYPQFPKQINVHSLKAMTLENYT